LRLSQTPGCESLPADQPQQSLRLLQTSFDSPADGNAFAKVMLVLLRQRAQGGDRLRILPSTQFVSAAQHDVLGFRPGDAGAAGNTRADLFGRTSDS
jgi:hypothetical protein